MRICSGRRAASCATSRSRSASGAGDDRGRQHARDPRLGAAARRPLLRGAGGGHPRRASAGAAERRLRRRRPAPGHPVRRPHRRGRAGARSGSGSAPAFRLADRPRGYVALDFAAFDAWYEEDERIFGHPRDPYHRVDIGQSARPVPVEIDGVSSWPRPPAPALLFETRLPTRFYLPREDVRVDLRPVTRRAAPVPLQGPGVVLVARRPRGHRVELRAAARGAAAIAGLVAFWDERVDVFVDGERRGRPGGSISPRAARRVRRLAPHLGRHGNAGKVVDLLRVCTGRRGQCGKCGSPWRCSDCVASKEAAHS